MSDDRKGGRFRPEIGQRIREVLARSRHSFQDLTREIYPESSGVKTEVVDQNPSDSKENAPPANDQSPSAPSVFPEVQRGANEPGEPLTFNCSGKVKIPGKEAK